VARSRKVGLSLASHTFSRHGAQLIKHRDNFTFYLFILNVYFQYGMVSTIHGLFHYYRLFYLWERRMDLSLSLLAFKSESKRGDYYVEINSGNFTGWLT
jgi:hypothetical protein